MSQTALCPDASTSVHPLETPELRKRPPADAIADASAGGLKSDPIHVHWLEARSRVYLAMKLGQQGQNRIEAFRTCGGGGWLMKKKNEETTYKAVRSFCKDRFCQVCQVKRQRTIRDNLIPLLDHGPYRFLTLTLRSSFEPLKTLLDKLISSFKQLRKHGLWKKNVAAGAAFIEVKWIAETRRWHPHLHCVLEGLFMPQAAIAAAWSTITKDSSIVDIRLIRDTRTVATYVCKYATKATDAALLGDEDRLAEAIETLRGRRTVMTFGRWRKAKLLSTEKDDGWECLCTVAEMRIRADDGDDLAAKIIAAFDHSNRWSEPFNIGRVDTEHIAVYPSV